MRKMHQIIRVENHIQTPSTPVVKTLEKHNERWGSTGLWKIMNNDNKAAYSRVRFLILLLSLIHDALYPSEKEEQGYFTGWGDVSLNSLTFPKEL